MKFTKYLPDKKLADYIKYFVVSENDFGQEYKVFPLPGLVLGFQYKGQLSTILNAQESKLNPSGITGITDNFKIFKSSANTGTVLVYFTETGFAHFAYHPANELFNLSVTLQDLFEKDKVHEVQEKLAAAASDKQRIQLVEGFLLSQLKEVQVDKLVARAVKMIYESKGALRIKDLAQQLFISQSPLEKRFRRIVGASLRKFSSIVRFNTALNSLGDSKTLTEICYENNYFDQAHFIKEFKQFTGDTPEKFKRFL